ncbi:amino acid ABC transporter substrate-binding protein [Asaia sp. W19]|uniref:substrate-binding periplasmic protein n=1 Tax=unclassified Asaia TaxID=2685023 RepID=UPI000F8C8DBF|nr:ABC transporter substrate-binding protein [Asaia sp. W19]RUT26434.1 amino acid ABC transporter substrate-binding protein [Asaia sp. W19]
MKWLGMLCAGAMLLTAPGAYAGCLERVRTAGVLRVGNGLLGAHPSLWQDAEGRYHGIDADLLAELTRRLDIPKSEFIITEWSTIVPGLKAGRWDIVLSDVNISEERHLRGHVLFSTPYFMLYDYVIVLENSPIRRLEDLRGKTVGSVMGTNDSATAHRLVEQGYAQDVADFETFGDPFIALKNGQVAAVIVDQGTLHAQKEHFRNLRTVGAPLFYTPKTQWAQVQARAPYRLGSEGVVVPEYCPDLLAAIDTALDAMRKDGTIRTILKRYGVWEPQQDHLIVSQADSSHKE